MEVIYPCCCGLDVHKRTVVACLLTPGSAAQPTKTIRTFSTMTADLVALADWLAAAGCTHVAMESTGVYWKPIWNLLEQRFHLLLVNARHSKAVPGRKTDVRDSEWLADLLQHGLLRGSFVPDRAQRELRELTRYRMALVRQRTAEANRLQKTLEGANIKLAAVATDILGMSGRQMLEALSMGTMDPNAMADLAKGVLRKKIAQLEQALAGQVGAHQRFLIRRHLRQIDERDAAIVEVSAEVAERVRPYAAIIARLDTIPGIGRYVAEAVIAEIGVDMSRFPSAQHLASWAGICPGNHESAGKRYSGRTGPGNTWLRSSLVQAAHAAVRVKDSYFAQVYRRLKARRGAGALWAKAIMAVTHRMLIAVYYMLLRHEPYRAPGAPALDEQRQQQLLTRMLRRIAKLGYTVSLEPTIATAT